MAAAPRQGENGTHPASSPPVPPTTERLRPQERVVTIPGFDIERQYEVVFAPKGVDPEAAPEPENGIAGPAPIALVLGLITLALALPGSDD